MTFLPFGVFAQTTTYSSSLSIGTWGTCPSANVAGTGLCIGSTYQGGGFYRLMISNINGNSISFQTSKCNGLTFGSGATFYLKESTSNTLTDVVCGTSYPTNGVPVAGISTGSYVYTTNFTTGTRYYCGVIIIGGTKYYTNTIAVTASTPQPTVTINTPPSGSWAFNSNQTVSWTTTNGGCAPYIVELSTNGGSNWTVIKNNFTGNSFTWTVGKYENGDLIQGMVNNSNLKLKVYCQNNTSVNSTSGSFSLATPSISITTPPTNSWSLGESRTINWATSNASCVYNIEVYNGTKYYLLKDYQSGNSFTWAVGKDYLGQDIPNLANNSNVHFKVYCTEYTSINNTSGNFTIKPLPTANIVADAISVSPNPIIRTQNKTISVNVNNTGTAGWSGYLSLVWKNNTTGAEVGILAGDPVFKTINAGGSITLTESSAVQSSAGSYTIILKKQDNVSAVWTELTRTSVQVVDAPINLSLSICMNFSTTSLTVGTTYNFTATIKNNGTTAWSGNLYLKVNNQSPSEPLGSVPSIPAGGTYPISYSFKPTAAHVGTNIPAEILYQTNGTGTGVTVPAGTCSNPMNITISPVGTCGAFTDLPNSGTNVEAFNAASCLCNLTYVNPQNYATNNANGVNPDALIYRADLAKLVYLTLFKNKNNSLAYDFPMPFEDLAKQYASSANSEYYNYAKALSYLEYGDGIAPFDRKFANFYPYKTIEKRYALKVLLEAFNIKPDNTTPAHALISAYIQPTEDGYGYANAAAKMGLIIVGSDIKTDIKRRDVFIMLHRLILSKNSNQCNSSYTVLSPTISDYFIPSNLTPENMGRIISMSEGVFKHREESTFNIPGFNIPMVFAHSYNSALLELPEQLHQIRPFGKGWSHNYNSYMFVAKGWTSGSTTIPDKLYVIWANGSIQRYNASSLASESIGVYDQLTASGTDYTVTTKSQMRYSFTRFGTGTDADPYIWMLASIKDRNNNTVSMTYEVANGKPRLIKVTDTGNRVMNIAYKAGTNYISTVSDVAGGRSATFDVDANGNLISYKNPKNNTYQYAYGTTPQLNLLHKITTPRGIVLDNTYDPNRKLVTSKLPGAATATTITNNYLTAYNGGATSITSTVKSPNNVISTTRYNGNGLAEYNNVGTSTTNITYNSAQPSKPDNITYNNRASSFTYFSNGNVNTVTLPNSAKYTYTYTALNDIATVTDPKNNTSRFYYDAAGNLDYATDNLGAKTDYTFDSRGLLKGVTNPENITYSFDYDTYGNQKLISGPLGITTSAVYDNVSRLKEATNPNSQTTKWDYDNNDLMTATTRVSTSGNVVTSHAYDSNDNLTTVTNALSGATTMTYNNKDMVESSTFGDDKQQFFYRDDQMLDYTLKPDGTKLQYTYDAQNRLTSDGYSTYTYDAFDNVKTITHNGKILTYEYDNLNRIDYYTDNYGKIVDYTYDLNGNLSEIIYPNSFKVTYEYDANNRLSKVTWNNISVVYTYFTDGRLKKATYPNGTYIEYFYDEAGRMTGISNKKSTNAVIAEYTFTLDNLGNHKSEQKKEPYGVPTLPNMTVSYQHNGENEITTDGTNTFTFDKNGNQTGKASTAATWDTGDKLLTYGSNYSYEYDGAGLMRRAARNGQISRYVWDAQGMGNILMETDDVGNPRYVYIHGLGMIARIKTSDNTLQYYHHDFRGSTVAMTDASQNITHKYAYDPFGKVTDMAEADANSFRYVGKYGVLAESNSFYYMRARFYDAETGRFLSEDPVWADNLYAYSDNNPVNFFDYNGEKGESINSDNVAPGTKNPGESKEVGNKSNKENVAPKSTPKSGSYDQDKLKKMKEDQEKQKAKDLIDAENLLKQLYSVSNTILDGTEKVITAVSTGVKKYGKQAITAVVITAAVVQSAFNPATYMIPITPNYSQEHYY